jgi:hypothetical protein
LVSDIPVGTGISKSFFYGVVRDIPAGSGKIANLFLQCMLKR